MTRRRKKPIEWEPVHDLSVDEAAVMCGHEDARGRWWQNWDRTAARESIETYWQSEEQAERRREYYSVVSSLVALVSEKRLLDFGCGTGEDYVELSSMGIHRYKGVDVEQSMLSLAREKHPGIDVEHDDIFDSKWGDDEWPIVINNAVLPHLPIDKIPVAVSELWRITRHLLVIRLFGVGNAENSTVVHHGFIYQRWALGKWLEFVYSLSGIAKSAIHQGESKATKDCIVIELWKQR